MNNQFARIFELEQGEAIGHLCFNDDGEAAAKIIMRLDGCIASLAFGPFESEEEAIRKLHNTRNETVQAVWQHHFDLLCGKEGEA